MYLVGSRHCFLTKDEVDKKVKEWQKSGKEANWIKERVDAVRDFILPDVEDMGTLVKIAKRKYTLANGHEIELYAIAVHEVFDPKASTKWLRLFATGGYVDGLKRQLVATKKAGGMDSKTLWGFIRGVDKYCAERSGVETLLISNGCGPVSVDQRSVGWGLGKMHRITGTMGDKFAKLDLPLVSDEQKREMLQQCLDSWYKRHPSSSAMKAGSDNEVPISEHIEALDWVDDLYDIGAIELTSDPDIGVSCDGIARMHVNEIVAIGTVEYKTRLALITTIEEAENAVRAHGRHVICNYGDEGVSKCIVTSNLISHASSLYSLFDY